LGDTFTHHGHFSLANFDSPRRGYLLPLIYHGLHGLARGLDWRDSSLAELSNALLLALIGTVLAPMLAEVAWPQRRWGVLRRLALIALLLVFWSGYLNFPLSDFPALTMALIALLAVARPYAAKWMLVAGFATGATIDMRPSYLILAPFVVALAAWKLRERRDGEQRILRGALGLGLAIVSFALVSLPQSLASHRHFGTYSFLPGVPEKLEDIQFAEGMKLELYGTYVGPTYEPEMFYVDDTGLALMREQPNRKISSTQQYLGLVFDHPLTFAGIFARHLVNGLDVRYSTPYADHLGTDWWLRMAGFLLTFAALLRVLWPRARRSLGPALWRYPLALLISCATVVPSAVETRYLLPAFIFSYMIVLAPGWPSPVAEGETALRRYRPLAVMLMADLLFAAIVWHVTNGASKNLLMHVSESK
jgi:hypothetical protein